MRSTRTSLAALAALALLGAQSVPTAPTGSAQTTASERSAQQQPAQPGKAMPSDTKAARLGTGYLRRRRAYVGKRYRASVRQHQRHAAKARNRRRARS